MGNTGVCIQSTLCRCKDLFYQKGIRGVSIEDIARNTSLSKAQIYKKFKNKEGIVEQFLNSQIDELKSRIEEVQNNSDNAIDELLSLHDFYISKFSKMNPVLFFDLKKFYTSHCQDYEQSKCSIHGDFMLQNFERGQQEDLYRSDFDLDIVQMLWEVKMEAVRNKVLYSGEVNNIIPLTNEIIELHLRSIASEQGIAYINTYLRTKNTK